MTTISPRQKKIQEIALFSSTLKARSMTNMLTEAAPKAVEGDKKGERQTSSHAPVVRVTDLQKSSGDSVDMQVVYPLTKTPTMGDRKIAGRGENLDFGDFELSINQGRHQVDAGGKMAQQRTNWNLRGTARTLLGGYFNTLQDQAVTVHMAGARGSFFDENTIVPLSDHDEFKEIMVNDVLPPTYDNHFYGGDATSLDDIDESDIFSLEAVDNLELYLEEMASPIQPIKYNGDEAASDEPFYLLMVTPRQWKDWQSTASYKDWQQLTANAVNRSRNFKHPVFSGECAMRGKILVRKYAGMPIRFNAGDEVSVCQNVNSAAVTTKVVGTNVDRAMLLGGQAIATAWGKTGDGNSFSVNEEKTDAGNRTEITIGWMNGTKKIRFPDKSGRVRDRGIMALDTAIRLK